MLHPLDLTLTETRVEAERGEVASIAELSTAGDTVGPLVERREARPLRRRGIRRLLAREGDQRGGQQARHQLHDDWRAHAICLLALQRELRPRAFDEPSSAAGGAPLQACNARAEDCCATAPASGVASTPRDHRETGRAGAASERRSYVLQFTRRSRGLRYPARRTALSSGEGVTLMQHNAARGCCRAMAACKKPCGTRGVREDGR